LTKKKPSESRLWQFDPSVFRPLRKAGLIERVFVGRGRSLLKHTLYLLAFAYPLILVTSGIMFGGLVFWTSLAGSMIVIWLVIKRAGYENNFANWDVGYKKFVGLFAAFGIFATVIYGFEYIKLMWTVAIFAGLLVTALILGVKFSHR
jgi:hypothetical protein